uniref:Uncharacterized protein n=1 Tax=Leersia perrieri TaxID=77586 RepID=A0A0D9WTJ8_9ORYZ
MGTFTLVPPLPQVTRVPPSLPPNLPSPASSRSAAARARTAAAGRSSPSYPCSLGGGASSAGGRQRPDPAAARPDLVPPTTDPRQKQSGDGWLWGRRDGRERADAAAAARGRRGRLHAGGGDDVLVPRLPFPCDGVKPMAPEVARSGSAVARSRFPGSGVA